MRRAGALAALLLVGGCWDFDGLTQLYHPDAATHTDLARPLDLAVVDRAAIDMSVADLTVDDLSMPDLVTVVDATTVDQTIPPDLSICHPPTLPATASAGELSIKLSGAQINGGSNFAHVAPSGQFTFSANFYLADPTCPSCDDQIIVGFAPSSPLDCLYDGSPANGVSGSGSVMLNAPSTPGTYVIRFHYGQAIGCDLTWWNINSMPPTSAQNIAAICVP
jgi:hypothetical protein